jgi:hypothetical protein
VDIDDDDDDDDDEDESIDDALWVQIWRLELARVKFFCGFCWVGNWEWENCVGSGDF